MMVWRGVRLSPKPMAGVVVCWQSPDEAWKVVRYDEGGPFYARLRIGDVYRVQGQAFNALDALEAARSAAQALRRELSRAIPRRER